MKKLLLATTGIAALTTGVQAADLPVKAPVAAPAAVAVSWTGCYVGAGGGYGKFNQETRFVGGISNPVSNDNSGRGFFGTVQTGCDYQAGSSWVIGAFADYDFSGIEGDMSVPVATWVGREEKLKSSWAVGGRV